MGVTYAVMCLDCGDEGPEVGDFGYIGYPSLDKKKGKRHIPNFGYIYSGLRTLGLLTPGVEEMREFLEKHRDGAFGRSVIKRYLNDPRRLKAATDDAEMRRFAQVVELFRKYGGKYEMDYLLMMAQGFQESRLDQQAKSPVGAIGVMQVMPATGKDLAVGDIGQLEPNIHAGVKYMRFMLNTFYANEPMTDIDKALFTFASYNCGPGRMKGLRAEAKKRGLDPNRWFKHVELVTADKIGAETVTYVSNIYKYYLAYKLVQEEEAERERAKDAMKKGAG